jgi:glycosyltransferase involved in cell wall biosynthesis
MISAISVVICAHNPRPDYLRRVLDALKAQTLSLEYWELLLIDNASKEPLALAWDLSWHPHARHLREDELGLTSARLRGIRESNGELLVFVDDDNVLARDYLSIALELSVSRNCVGAFGGNVIGEFETLPESWVDIMYQIFAVVSVKHEQWTCSPGTTAQLMAPCGSGMVIRKNVAAYWARMSVDDPLRRGLGRKGASLAGSEDIDMSLCACVLGLAVGRFPQLQLTHLIASRRLKREYLLRLAEEATFSDAILQYVWNRQLPLQNQGKLSGSEKIFRAYRALRYRLSNWRNPSFAYEHTQACNRGLARAVQLIKSDNTPTTTVLSVIAGAELNPRRAKSV